MLDCTHVCHSYRAHRQDDFIHAQHGKPSASGRSDHESATHYCHDLAEHNYTFSVVHELLPIFLFLELTLVRLPLRAASCCKYLAGPYHAERFGSDFAKASTVSSAVPLLLSLGFHLCPFHIERNKHYTGCP